MRSRLLALVGSAAAVGALVLFALGGDADSDVGQAPATTLSPRVSGETADGPTATTAIGPLDRELGIDVLTLSRGALRRTDLDSGVSEQINLATTRGRSLLRFGEDVVLANLDLGELTEVADEPFGLDRVVLVSRFASITVASDGALVVFDVDRTTLVPVWSVLRSFDEDPERLQLPESFRATSVAAVTDDGAILNSQLGAVVWNGSLVQQELEGLILAVVEDRGLWFDCDDALTCGLRTGVLGTRGDLVARAAAGLQPSGTFEVQVAGDIVTVLGQGVSGDNFDLLRVDLQTGAHQQFVLQRTGGVAPGAWSMFPDGSGVVGTSSVFLFDCGCLLRHGADLLPVAGLEGNGLVAVSSESS